VIFKILSAPCFRYLLFPLSCSLITHCYALSFPVDSLGDRILTCTFGFMGCIHHTYTPSIASHVHHFLHDRLYRHSLPKPSSLYHIYVCRSYAMGIACRGRESFIPDPIRLVLSPCRLPSWLARKPARSFHVTEGPPF